MLHTYLALLEGEQDVIYRQFSSLVCCNKSSLGDKEYVQ